MVTTRQKAVSSAAPELLAPSRTNAATQTELLFRHAPTQVSGCGMCEGIFLEVESDCKQDCGRCDQIDELLCLVAELQEEVSRLRSIRESEKEIDQWSRTLPSMMHRSQLSVATMEAGPGSALCQEEGSVTRDKEGWKKVTAQSGKRNPSLPSKITLQNRYEALGTVDEAHNEKEEEPVQAVLPRSERPTPRNKTCIKTSAEKEQRRVMVIGDSLLCRTEAPICRPDPLFREVCCLPGAQIRDVTTRLESLVQPSDYYPFLLFHVGTNDVATKSLRSIKRDFRALGRMLKTSGAQVVFSSILPVMGGDLGRNRRDQDINTWLQDWCLRQNFGVLNHGRAFKRQDLYYGGEAFSVEQPQSFTCPYCGKMGYTETSLQEHVASEHAETSTEICPICAALPGGDPNHVTDDFAAHLTLEHRAPRDLDESSGVRHVRRMFHPGRGLGGPRARRSNMHFTSSSTGGLSSSQSSYSPSNRETMDPIAELLSQLSGVRRSAGQLNSSGPSASQLQQLQMQLQLERQHAQAARQQLETARNATRRTNTSSIPATLTQSIAAANTSNTENNQQTIQNSQFLLTRLNDPKMSEAERQSKESERADRSLFVQELLLSTLMREESSSSDEDERGEIADFGAMGCVDIMPLDVALENLNLKENNKGNEPPL
ncbi:uncharacterized protein LOC142074828 isoform X2 [Calonectris borealis]|uniref:uncharacterized protein LOC142074828 isoform X2 n=1 Tax=Calonectris borealis TaxID=1323832 RepID=UPI003F4C5551